MRTTEEIAFLKAELCDRVATGTLTTQAMAALQISFKELKRWRQEDPAFGEALVDAQDHLTEVKADELVTMHDTVLDPKRAHVASTNLRWWLAKRRPDVFGERVPIDDDRGDLTEIIRKAIARIPRPGQSMKLIDAQTVDCDESQG